MQPCPACQVYADMVQFLQEQVRVLTDRLVTLNNPMLAMVQTGAVMGPAAVEHTTDERGQTLVTLAGQAVPKDEWEKELHNLERYQAGLPSLHSPEAEGVN